MTPAHRAARRDRLRDLALVGVGGACGTAARAWLESVAGANDGTWPWATFGINVAGAAALGLLLGWLGPSADAGRRRIARLALGTGLLGGFTTYSAFAVEASQLAGGGHGALAVGYAIGSVLLGLVAAWAGLRLGRLLPGPPRRDWSRS